MVRSPLVAIRGSLGLGIFGVAVVKKGGTAVYARVDFVGAWRRESRGFEASMLSIVLKDLVDAWRLLRL